MTATNAICRLIISPLPFCAILQCYIFGHLAQSQLQPSDGYTLYTPNNSKTTYLVDIDKQVVHSWSHALSGGYCVYLLENGNLLRPASVSRPQIPVAASSGLLQEIDWSGQIVWEFPYNSSSYISHHDIEPMPNGNVLLIASEVKTSEQAKAMGRTISGVLWPDHIIEVRPIRPYGGEIVWEWHAWDHLIQQSDPNKPNFGIISEYPERFDVNLPSTGFGFTASDWLHVNGISYNAERDEIVITSHNQCELYVIDHSTSTEEAIGRTGGRRGKGGDILYRWGKPSNYGRGGADVFNVVHCPFWIHADLPGSGNILAFNNNAAPRTSAIMEITPPRDSAGNYYINIGDAYGPESPEWTYRSGTAFFSNHLGSNQRLPNGNTLIAEGTTGRIFEVTRDGYIVWSMNTGKETPRAVRYPRNYPGLAALHNTNIESVNSDTYDFHLSVFPNPFSHQTVLEFSVQSPGLAHLCIYDVVGRRIASIDHYVNNPGKTQLVWDGTNTDGGKVPPGVYLVTMQASGNPYTRTLIVIQK